MILDDLQRLIFEAACAMHLPPPVPALMSGFAVVDFFGRIRLTTAGAWYLEGLA